MHTTDPELDPTMTSYQIKMGVRLSPISFVAVLERCTERLPYLCGHVFRLNGYFCVVLILEHTLH